MTKTINATQQSLRLLVYSLAGISVFFIVLRLLMTYVLGSPGMVTAALVLVVSLIWAAQRSQQFRAKNEQEALLMQHRAFAAEVERAWERSHANGLERRKPERPTGVTMSVPSHTASATEGTKKRKKKKRGQGSEDEETFIVDDELEAEVVEDLEDFLEHSRLRQTLKKTADELRVSQKRKEDKKTPVAEAEVKKAPETKAPSVKTKKEVPEPPAKGGAGKKGANRERLGEDGAKNHKESKDQPAHRKASARRGTNGTKQGWQDEWYGESSWWPEKGWGEWSNDWWPAAKGGANGRNGRKDHWARGTSGHGAPQWK